MQKTPKICGVENFHVGSFELCPGWQSEPMARGRKGGTAGLDARGALVMDHQATGALLKSLPPFQEEGSKRMRLLKSAWKLEPDRQPSARVKLTYYPCQLASSLQLRLHYRAIFSLVHQGVGRRLDTISAIRHLGSNVAVSDSSLGR